MTDKPLRGIVPPLVTPLLDRDTLDEAGLDRLLEHTLAGGVAGFFILGTTGEGPLLGDRLRRELVSRVCRQVRHRVPVLVCVNDTAFVEALSLARHAADCGADAIVSSPPCYLPLGQPELHAYFHALAAESPLPMFLYNFPTLTKTTIEIETVRRAADNPRIIGIKDSSGDLGYFQRLLGLAGARPDWTIMNGPDDLLGASVLAGGHGGVNAGANVFPKLYTDCCRAALDSDLGRTRDLQARIRAVTASLYHMTPHASALIQGVKCALSLLGICHDAMTAHFAPLGEAERERVRREMEELR